MFYLIGSLLANNDTTFFIFFLLFIVYQIGAFLSDWNNPL